MFARAAPTGSRLLATSHVGAPSLRSWATLAPRGTLRVVLINDSASRRLTVAVRPPHSAGAATLERLLAPGLRAAAGVTLGGQTFGAASPTGELSGALKTTTLTPVQHRYLVDLGPASAALLTLQTR